MTQIIHGRVDTKAYKEAMKKNGLQMPSIEKRESIVDFPTESNPFIVHLIMSAEISVLKQLGISSTILRNLTRPELRILSTLLQKSMMQVMKELGRKGGR